MPRGNFDRWHASRGWQRGFIALLLWTWCGVGVVVSGSSLPKRTDFRSRATNSFAKGVELRVLPIGDSITFGRRSTDGNGYRKRVFDYLAEQGNTVNFVGGSHDGTMADNDHEGHPSFEINGIKSESNVGIYAAPNIVLLHAGTNDIKDNADPDNAPTRLASLIDYIFKLSPDAVVFVCKIIPASPNNYPNTAKRIPAFNDAIGKLVSDKYADKKVRIVDMSVLLVSDLADGLHPNDGGYAKMAEAYWKAIQEAEEEGLIVAPGKAQTPPTGTSPDNCRATPSWYNQGRIAKGAKVSESDGPFKPSWVDKGVIAKGFCNRDDLHFLDLDGDGLRDYACVNPKNGSVVADLNVPDANGHRSGDWKKLGMIATGKDGRNGTRVMFADLNGDGRDDYVYVDDGKMYGWINMGPGADGKFDWLELGQIADSAGEDGDKQIQMVDLNGDGRDDLCLVDVRTGGVQGWINIGADRMPEFQKIDSVATGASFTSGDYLILGDLTGEGRADYMMVGTGGKVNAFVNRLDPLVPNPRWSELFALAEGPDGVKGNQVRLVDMTGDGKVDYLTVDGTSGAVHLWENTGTGGKYQPGEGVFLCDLDGDGAMDYFWVAPDGKGYGYLNVGKGTDAWNDLGLIANGNHDRNLVRMGVLTKSHRADYIVLDEKTGRAVWYRNLGNDENWGWGPAVQVADGPSDTLKSSFGMDFRAGGVHFVDLTGDGLEDYVYVGERGATVMWKNKGTDPPSFGDAHLIADGPVGVRPEQVQFADVDGDGRIDYNQVGTVYGSVMTWHNLGLQDDGSIRWNTPMSFAAGTGQGQAIRLADMTGDGRADYVRIDFDTAGIDLWVNRCWPVNGGGGGDRCDNPGNASWHGAIPDGDYFPAFDGNGHSPGTWDQYHRTYLTLLNGSPDDFDLTSSHHYQIDVEYGSVPAGSSLQMMQKYSDVVDDVDDKAEAYYTIDGTDQTFQVWARTHFEAATLHPLREVIFLDNFSTDDQPKGTSVELEDHGGYRAFNLVITGSKKYGHYWTSLDPPTSWMQAILDVIGDRKLRHVSMIGSHDAGMSTLNGSTQFITPENVLTQYYNIYDQLRAGSRFFDIRPVIGNGGHYLTGHYSGKLGGNGESINGIVQEVNKFTDSNAELVILHLSHFSNTDDGYRDLNDEEYSGLFDILEGLKHLCGGLDGDLTDMTINDFIGNGEACVIVITDQGTPRPNKGIYSTSENFRWDGEGYWSNTDNMEKMANSQLEYLASHRNIAKEDNKDAFLVMQWILTLEGLSNVPGDNDTSISIRGYASRGPHDALFWKAWNAFTPQSYPNVVLLDAVGNVDSGQSPGTPITKELIAFAMAMNLAIASKNCLVGGGTIY